ncbi:hypothetical protein P9139_07265 [Curtobacterium flaccumfaciens]|nr:hypothetical protein P9139_07265 [Curtobacterium flaccumfaciens]
MASDARPATEMARRSSGTRWRGRRLAVGQEALGALVALALSVIALRHVVATARVALLWYDGDSVLLPLVERSLQLGQPFEWAMSPALFFFPELPVYLLCSLVTATPQQALALNGVLVLLAVYALVRAAANELMPAARRSARVTVSAVALGFVTLLVLTESSATATSLELASLLLTTTYYYGAVLAMLGTAVLVLRAVRVGRASVAVLVVLGLLAACTTASNPLYVPWSGAPVVVTLVLLALARRLPWRPVVLLGGTVAAGSVVGYLLRIPLRPFVSLDPSTYVRPSRAGETLGFFAALTDDRAGSAAGDAGLLLLFVGVLLAVGARCGPGGCGPPGPSSSRPRSPSSRSWPCRSGWWSPAPRHRATSSRSRPSRCSHWSRSRNSPAPPSAGPACTVRCTGSASCSRSGPPACSSPGPPRLRAPCAPSPRHGTTPRPASTAGPADGTSWASASSGRCDRSRRTRRPTCSCCRSATRSRPTRGWSTSAPTATLHRPSW